MTDGLPSATARRVAAYRLRFDRPAVGYGCPEADDALAHDVADADGRDTDAMDRYLRGRTAFFDGVVIRAIERGVTQVVNVGAGYDGRALRYAKPGVRWWEVDHPDTQADKVARLARLGIDAAHVSFVGHDLRAAGLSAAVAASGIVAEEPSLLLCEGVALYLDLPVLEALLADLRLLATGGSRLALSLSGPSGSPERAARRRRLEAAVKALGEPARNALTASGATGLFDSTGWRQVRMIARAGAAGFVMLAPSWEYGSHRDSAAAGAAGPGAAGPVAAGPVASDRELLDFDARALLAALDAERARRALSWAGVAAAIWDQSHVLNARRGDHPISASTITGMGKGGQTDCQHALFMLRWLAAEPEAFLAGAPPPAGAPLPAPGPEHRIRWDLAFTAAELDRQRRQLGLTWPDLARQLRCPPAMLTGIRRARFTINMGLAMRITQWLGRPAADFVYVADW